MDSSFYSFKELESFGFKKLGENVLISRKASIYSASKIEIGSNVRIDDFCILSGKITLGSFIHISAYTSLFAGDAGILLEDYTTVSSRCALYAVSDDYSGDAMTNPMVPEKFRNVEKGTVTLKKFSIVGSGCTVLPGVTLGVGAAVGSMSLIKISLDGWGIYVGIPARKIKDRSKKIIELEKQFREEFLK